MLLYVEKRGAGRVVSKDVTDLTGGSDMVAKSACTVVGVFYLGRAREIALYRLVERIIKW